MSAETSDEEKASPPGGRAQSADSAGRGSERRAVPPPYNFEDFERRSQDPHPSAARGLISLLVVRPVAMQVAWRLAVARVPAAAVSGAALFCATAGSLLCWTIWGWIPGLLLLEAWLVLEHAETLLRRFQRVSSLDVEALARLVRHVSCVMVPVGIGYGFVDPKTDAFLGVPLGWIWGLSLLAIGLKEDVRARAYMLRLGRLRGDLRVCGPPPPPVPRGIPLDPLAGARWLVRKSCDPVVWLNVVLLGTLFVGWIPVVGGGGVFMLVAYLSLSAFFTAVQMVLTGLRDHEADDEFAKWFPPPAGCELVEDGGWWYVTREAPPEPASNRKTDSKAGAAADTEGKASAPFEADVVDPPKR